MYCEITTPKAVFKLDIVRNVTVIQGHSGSGKTYLCESISRGEKAGTRVRCDMSVYNVYPVDVEYDKWFSDHAYSILFIDETVMSKATNEFCRKALENGCRLVLCTRKIPKNIEYAVSAILVLHRSGKYVTAEPKYVFSTEHKKYKLVVEDSGSGLEFYKHVCSDVISAGGKENIVKLITEDKLFKKTYVVDGAVFGSNLSSIWQEYVRGNIDIVAPESLEFVLLHSPLVYSVARDVLLNPEKHGASSGEYYSWERFFTDYLKDLMEVAGGYSKSSKIRCFTESCCYKDKPCCYARNDIANKVEITLRNAGLGWMCGSSDADRLKKLLPPSVAASMSDSDIINNFSYILDV